DCGGNACARCANGAACLTGADCESQSCDAGVCAAPRCDDGLRGDAETDVDCGGVCPPCAASALCRTDHDCAFGQCSTGRCELRLETINDATVSRLGSSLTM